MTRSLNTFKKICFEIETFTNRTWTVVEVPGYEYPKNYYCGLLLKNNLPSQKVALLRNLNRPIFAVTELKKNNFIPNSFIWIDEIYDAVKHSMASRNQRFEFLNPEILNLEYFNFNDFQYKVSKAVANQEDIRLTMEELQPEKWEHKLFYNGNIGYNLFNEEND